MSAAPSKSPYSGRIKIFLDGADRATMMEMATNPVVQGFTTNPSLMRKAGVTDYRGYCQEIIHQLGGKPVSFEVFADDFPTMRTQALEIRTWEKKGAAPIYVKIPVINTLGESAIPLIRELSHQGVKLNVTAVYTLPQVWEVAQALKGGAASILSVFAGRIADTGRDPVPLMQAAAELCDSTDTAIELLWASTREAYNIVQAEQTGCRIITAPADMIRKVPSFNRPVMDVCLDTVKVFKKDSEAAGFRL
ncbi:MAG: transaldolase [Oligoflexia bacterium]|nr:transaldolase [Oligoflexia bacterium]